MLVSEAPTADVRPLLEQERARLLELLTALDSTEWTCPTPVPGWRIKDIALHLLDDDLRWLSRGRDRDKSGLIDPSGDSRSLVEALAEKNQRWIDAANGLSQRLACDLLEWSGRRVDEFLVTADLAAPAKVSWASDDAVPQWLDLAREFTERWVHHRQICEGLARAGDGLDQYLGAVLDTFVWAFPHQYRVDAEPGTQVEVVLGDDRCWCLTRNANRWDLELGGCDSPAARVEMSGDTAWRFLTGAPYDQTGVSQSGRPDLSEAVLSVRGIIV